MTALIRTLRDFAELSRISNLPTTFSHVLVGAAIGLSSRGTDNVQGTIGASLLLVWLAIACFYIAGMIMNDVIDARIDKLERPTRPIPSGRVSLPLAIAIMVTLIIAGVAICAVLGVKVLLIAIALVIGMILYNLLHVRFATSVILMAATRYLVYLTAALATSDVINWKLLHVYGGAMAIYIIAISTIARREMSSAARPFMWLAEVAIFAALLPAFLLPSQGWSSILLPLVIAAAWISRAIVVLTVSKSSVKKAVMMLLAGICLVDALYLAMLGQYVWWIMASACFLVTALSHRRIPGS